MPILNCSLGNENPVTDLSARKVSILSKHNKIVDALIQSQLTDLTVDDESRLLMAEAIEFSGINTLEKAKSSNLRIIPPGSVFHTWYARYQTGLFDGENNPAHVKGLNYVARIDEQSNKLMKWEIPVILIYLERDMPPLEVKKMQTIFSRHENILVMSLEHDLTSLRSTAYYKSDSAKAFLDDPIFSLCREFPEVLSLAQKKAKSVGKTLLLHNLLELGGLSIIYSDIDNTFLHMTTFQMAVNGGRNACPFCVAFSLQSDKLYKKYPESPSIDETAKKYRDIFSHEGVTCIINKRYSKDILKDRSETLYKYLLSGEAMANYRVLEPDLSADINIFVTEYPGYIVMNKEALAIVDQSFNNFFGFEWMMTFVNKQKFNDQLLKLHGLQQLKQIHIGRDMTWGDR